MAFLNPLAPGSSPGWPTNEYGDETSIGVASSSPVSGPARFLRCGKRLVYAAVEPANAVNRIGFDNGVFSRNCRFGALFLCSVLFRTARGHNHREQQHAN